MLSLIDLWTSITEIYHSGQTCAVFQNICSFHSTVFVLIKHYNVKRKKTYVCYKECNLKKIIKFSKISTFSENATYLSPGRHIYPFSFILPTNLPSSFEATCGRIRYTIRAIIDRPWKFDHEAKAAITVISPLDLNQRPWASEQVDVEMSKTFCCFACRSGPLLMNVVLPVRGYVSGQQIPIKIKVNNGSGIRINGIQLISQKVGMLVHLLEIINIGEVVNNLLFIGRYFLCERIAPERIYSRWQRKHQFSWRNFQWTRAKIDNTAIAAI